MPRKPPPQNRQRLHVRIKQELLDQWFLTVVRYTGLALMVYAAVVDQGRNPALIPAAGGMIALKTVYKASNGEKD